MKIIYISDIHFGLSKEENQGKVLKSFIEDVSSQVKDCEPSTLYLIISGDLVQNADEPGIYDLFHQNFMIPLLSGTKVPANNVVIIPGNHDLQRSEVIQLKDIYFPMLDKKMNEADFNNIIHNERSRDILYSKFNAFNKYASTVMGEAYNEKSFGIDLGNGWGLFCLNSAIFSSGGVDSKDDRTVLGFDTRSLNAWLQNTSYKHRILVSHHPHTFCMEWANHEIKNLVKSHFNLVLSGHVHDQEMINHVNGNDSYIHLQSPQLFTSKDDNFHLGYSIIDISEDAIEKITFREWFENRNKFRSGINFTEEDDGVVYLSKRTSILQTHKVEIDLVETLLEKRLKELMTTYVGQPFLWVDRFITNDRIDYNFSLTKSELYSEQDIINTNQSFQLVAPPQYGLTCYGIHFALTLWRNYKQFALFLDFTGKTKKFERYIESVICEYGIDSKKVSWIIIDNWNLSRTDAQVILNYLKSNYPDTPVMLLCQYSERFFMDHDSLITSKTPFPNYFLAPIKFEQIRQLSDAYNAIAHIADSNILVNRVETDIRKLHLHRTPFSCVTLLTVFSESFDESPVNRTSVIKKILYILFENSSLPTYRDSLPDVRDCEVCLGYFCSNMINDESFTFTYNDFYTQIQTFCNEHSVSLNIKYLFDVLVYNRILVPIDNQLYQFRFSFWVYYFAAMFMHDDSAFANTVLINQNYLKYPEMLEYYTGKERKALDAVNILSTDLASVIKSVLEKSGVQTEQNPFAILRFNQSEEASRKIIQELEDNVQISKLPQEIKDSVKDMSYNPSEAFNQSIHKIYIEYSIGHLIKIIEIGSKVLRNSDYVKSSYKEKLLSTIVDAWKTLSTFIYLVSPSFAKNGYVELGGFSFKLCDGYNQYETDEERAIQIIVNIPRNMMLLFKDDLYSAKLSDLLTKSFNNESDKIKKHLLACLLIYQQPSGWDICIIDYIGKIGKDSYYLGTLIDLMQDLYYLGELENSNRSKMKNLLKTALYKSQNGKMPPSGTILNRISLIKPEYRELEASNDHSKESVQE